MQAWSLDLHPMVETFRSFIPGLSHSKDKFFHLFLPAPYAIPAGPLPQPMPYVFVSTRTEPNLIIQCVPSKLSLKFDRDAVVPVTQFPKPFSRMRILLSTPCSCPDGFSFTMHETLGDLFNPIDPPAICRRIMEVAPNGDQAISFLQKETSNPKLRDAMKAIDSRLDSMVLNTTTLPDCVETVKAFMDDVADLVFAMPVTKTLPIALRSQLNLTIFNAISTKAHFKLLVAYHEAYHDANARAQQATRFMPPQKPNEAVELALLHLKSILHMPTAYDSIRCVVKFFEGIVSSLPGQEIAADDILPAICAAMAQDLGFGSHVVSFFQYLVDLWPSTGLDEKISYILITCSIAATHLSTLKKAEKPKEPEVPVESPEMAAQREETIDMLENLLDML
jgi:hypothetical protein